MKARIPWVWVIAALAILPRLLYASSFADLFWFGDDWDLLDQISRLGYWRWVTQPFAENFVPLFKLIWGGTAILTGSYQVMVWMLWITHAINVVLLRQLLNANGVPARSTLLVTAIFALSPANVETLCWATQWSAVISMTFFLAAAYAQSPRSESGAWGRVLLLGCALASALCFSRGVVTGISLGLVALYPARHARYPSAQQWVSAAACWLPSVAVAITIAKLAGGNQQHLSPESLLKAGEYAFYFFALNPLYQLLPLDGWSWHTAVALTLANIACIVWVWAHATDQQRKLIATLTLFALGSAALVGIGRFHTGLDTVPSSRYQYSAQICMLPIYALGVERIWAWLERLKMPRRAVSAMAGFAAIIIAGSYLHAWGPVMANWSVWRGREARELLLVNPAPPAENAVPGIDFMPTQRAKELIKEYHLAEQPQPAQPPRP